MDANIKSERQVAARHLEKRIGKAKRHSHTAVPFCYVNTVGRTLQTLVTCGIVMLLAFSLIVNDDLIQVWRNRICPQCFRLFDSSIF